MSNSRSGKTVRLTVAQAVVTYLSKQYSVADGERRRLIPATLGIFGHGNVAGLGQALDQLSDVMPFMQGRNEQSLAHLAIGYAKANRRHTTLAVTASIGPAAMRVLTDPVDTGAVVLSLPQDVQSHAFDFPAEFFVERDWVIRRPIADPDEVAAVARLLARAQKPIIIAGGGVVYSDATAELEALAGSAGIPVLETMAGKGAVQQRAWWQIGGIGLEGTPVNNDLVRQADFVLTVGSRLTDFPTASQSLFENPDVQFASINVNGYDAQRLGATGIVGDAKRALAALAAEVAAAGFTSPQEWQDKVRTAVEGWEPVRAAALDPDTPFDRASIPADFGDIVPDTGALLTQGQVIGLMQEHARAGDTIVAAAGGPPGDLQKVWDATEGRFAHLEFGFSCMGYEIPAGMGVRLADPNPDSRVVVFIGDGTFLMSPTELVTAAQESIAVTVMIPENRGYQVIHRLQMGRHGTEFGNEFRYRTSPLDLASEKAATQPQPRL